MNFELLNALSHLETPQGVIAFPTDTVYGLGCMVDKPQAVERIYRIKGRDETKPLILLGRDEASFQPYVSDIPPRAIELMHDHWPGALTIILPKSERLPDTITRGMQTVGLRIPACPLFLDMLSLVPQGLLATTSANRSGDPPCLTGREVHDTFGDDVDYVLVDDAAIHDKVASTVVAVEPDGSLHVLRTGAVVLD